jgi:hypothetical protein
VGNERREAYLDELPLQTLAIRGDRACSLTVQTNPVANESQWLPVNVTRRCDTVAVAY